MFMCWLISRQRDGQSFHILGSMSRHSICTASSSSAMLLHDVAHHSSPSLACHWNYGATAWMRNHGYPINQSTNQTTKQPTEQSHSRRPQLSRADLTFHSICHNAADLAGVFCPLGSLVLPKGEEREEKREKREEKRVRLTDRLQNTKHRRDQTRPDLDLKVKSRSGKSRSGGGKITSSSSVFLPIRPPINLKGLIKAFHAISSRFPCQSLLFVPWTLRLSLSKKFKRGVQVKKKSGGLPGAHREWPRMAHPGVPL